MILNIGYSTMVYAQAEIVVGLFYNNANLAISNVGKMDLDALSLNGHKPIGAAVAGAAKKKPCAMMTALTINGNLQLSICSVGNEEDEKIIAIAKKDPFLNGYKDISELPEQVVKEIMNFFEVYKTLEGKTTTIDEIQGRKDAEKIIFECIENYKHKFENM